MLNLNFKIMKNKVTNKASPLCNLKKKNHVEQKK